VSNKITEYAVVEELTVRNLELIVKEHIELGWQPLGGVSISHGLAYREDCEDTIEQYYYAQAMVKYGEENVDS